jgi:SEC-C motif
MSEKEKVGRNEPCPCGSGKKYKNCHMKTELPAGKKKFTASIMKPERKQIDLMERTFGSAIERTKAPVESEERPSVPPEEIKEIENERPIL